jgi:ATP-dependent Clp protease ATP-binding subunit ClpB
MTSNLGSHELQAGLSGKDKTLTPALRQEVMEALKDHFRPEFLNRVDETVIFEPLRQKDIAHIVDLQLVRLEKLLAEKRLALRLSAKARTFLAEQGYDPVYGARPLKRAIQKYVQDPLALKILSAEFLPGDTIEGEVAGEALKFTAAPRA